MTKLANKVLEAVPGTPEHAIAKQLETGGDISVETGEPLDDSGMLPRSSHCSFRMPVPCRSAPGLADSFNSMINHSIQ